MDDVEATPLAAVETPVETGSLRERAAARRRELEHEHEVSILLPMPGYEDLFAVQYRAMGAREMFTIENRSKDDKESYDKYWAIASDKLVAACERILEVKGPDTYEDTGFRLNAKAARELFDCSLPENASARIAMHAIFGASEEGDERLTDHAGDYELQRKGLVTKVDKRVEGESGAVSVTS